jgi:predicted  nucleic acid-binding Zn-ribbon protein
MASGMIGFLTARQKQLDELVAHYRSELDARVSAKSAVRQDFEQRIGDLVDQHSQSLSELSDSVRAAKVETVKSLKDSYAKLRISLKELRTNLNRGLGILSDQVQTVCFNFEGDVRNISDEISEATSTIEREFSREFEDLRKSSNCRRVVGSSDIALRTVRIGLLEKQIGMLKSMLLELDHEHLLDIYRMCLLSSQSSNLYEKVWTSSCFLSELDLLRRTFVHPGHLRDATCELNEVLEKYEEKRLGIARDRIECEGIWNSIFWRELDSIQDVQLELNVNTCCYLNARLRNLAANHRKAPFDASREIQQLRETIASLERQIRRNEIAFESELRSRQSEFVVRLQDLRQFHAEQIQVLQDRRDGLVGVLEERIEVLSGQLESPPEREQRLKKELKLLTARLTAAQEKLAEERSSLSLRRSKSRPV